MTLDAGQRNAIAALVGYAMLMALPVGLGFYAWLTDGGTL